MDSKFFVPYQTAQQLKEKRYPQESDYMYCAWGRHWRHLTLYQMNKINAIASPTYHEVVDWLAEKGVRIEVRMGYRQKTEQWLWCGHVYVVEDEEYETSMLVDWCSTREDALNAAILKASEML